MSGGVLWRAMRGAAWLVTAAACLAPAFAAPAQRPNILWLVGENLTHDLGCYGAANVHTPHLDQLAAHGVRYTRVFATNPTCAPSRSAFFTGMYQTTTDTHHMRSHRNDGFRLPPGVRPITHWLRDAGYFTANIKTVDGHTVGTGKLDLNFVNEGAVYHPDSDDWSALRQRQPFFAVVNSVEVHDLAGSPAPEHREALLRLRAALDVWIADTGDRGALPEPPEVVAPFAPEMHDWFGTPSWYDE